MSLYLDLLDLLRHLLEYFGVPADLLVPVWENQLCGQYRSIIRMIGTTLPLSPCPRVCFQKISDLHALHSTESTPAGRPFVPSFADVLWVAGDENETCAMLRGDRRTNCIPVPPEQISMLSQSIKRVVEKEGNSQTTDAGALKKITALEDELSRLRAQIAMIVTMQDQGSSMSQSGFMQPPGTPGMPLLPVLASTPICMSAPPPSPPPPPPPPPSPPLPPPPSCRTAQVLDVDLNRQRCATNRSGQRNRDNVSAPDSIPSMLHVLRDMNKVRLQAVERSPGGTPVMKKDKKRVLISDPAALIADALKRKVAHRHKEDSFDKENQSFETSPFGSPETHKIEPQVLKVPGKHIPFLRLDKKHTSPLQ